MRKWRKKSFEERKLRFFPTAAESCVEDDRPRKYHHWGKISKRNERFFCMVKIPFHLSFFTQLSYDGTRRRKNVHEMKMKTNVSGFACTRIAMSSRMGDWQTVMREKWERMWRLRTIFRTTSLVSNEICGLLRGFFSSRDCEIFSLIFLSLSLIFRAVR